MGRCLLGDLLDHRLGDLLDHRLGDLLNLFGRDNQAITFSLAPDPVSLGLHHARGVALHSDS